MISYLRGIRTLHLQNNQLTSLPPTLVNCRHLSELDLTQNQLSSLPKGLGALKALRVLKIGKNQLEQVCAAFLECMDYGGVKRHLHCLDWVALLLQLPLPYQDKHRNTPVGQGGTAFAAAVGLDLTQAPPPELPAKDQ